MSVLFLFIDGVGIGKNDSSMNPFKAATYPGLERLFNEGRVYASDTTLEVEGLPQSATGQTAIFTGVNAPMKIGKHLSGRTTENLRRIIEQDNLFLQLIRRGLSVNFANVYRDEYIENIGKAGNRRESPSVTTSMTLSAGLKLRNVSDYRIGEGIYHDITGQILMESGYSVNLLAPADAAKVLVDICHRYDFTLFEHFMSDIVGHKGDMSAAVSEVKLLNEFISAILDKLDFEKDLLVMASDHGNLEDKSVKTHTMNKVPVIFYGKITEGIDLRINSLVDIMPELLKIFDQRIIK